MSVYQTPLIRLVDRFFSYNGLQLRPVRSLSGYINFLWNLAFDLCILYSLLQPTLVQPFISACDQSKPLFNSVASFALHFIPSTCFLVAVVCGFFNGRKLLHSLDSVYFKVVYPTKRYAQYSLIIVTISINLLFAVVVTSQIRFFRLIESTIGIGWQFGLMLLSKYITNYCQTLLCIIMHYYLHATLVNLTDVNRILGEISASASAQDKALRTFIDLAHLNLTLNRLIALPLLSYILKNVIHVIVGVCFALLCETNIYMLSDSLFFWLYLAHLTCLSEQIEDLAKQICLRLRVGYQDSGRLWAISRKVRALPWNRQRESRAMMLQHSDLFRKYFQIRMFDFVTLRLPFILRVALFIGNFVLLLMQTN